MQRWLRQENCYYLATLVQEIVTLETEASTISRDGLTGVWDRIMPTGTRREVMQLQNRSDDSYVCLFNRNLPAEST